VLLLQRILRWLRISLGQIWGSLKGKSTGGKATHIEINHPTPIPIKIMNKYHLITLAIDIMFLNNIPFLTSISQHIGFGTAERLIHRQATSIVKAIKGLCHVYSLRGFKISTILGDNEFEPLRGELSELHIQLNVVAVDKHVPEIERYNCTIKEHCCSIYNTLPFTKIPQIMVAHMVYFSVFWLNSFPRKDGIEELSEGMDNQIAGVDPNTIDDTFAGAVVNPTLRRSTRMIKKP
jgi:hypothetical protein